MNCRRASIALFALFAMLSCSVSFAAAKPKPKTKEELAKEKKEKAAAEKARKAAEKKEKAEAKAAEKARKAAEKIAREEEKEKETKKNTKKETKAERLERIAKEQEEAARKNWIEGQKEFAIALGQKQYLDLAQKVLDDTARGDPRIEMEPLDEEERKLLKVAESEIKITLIRGRTDPAERMKLADEAIKAMREAADSVAEDSPLKLATNQSLMKTYVELGELFVSDWDRTGNKETRSKAGKYFSEAKLIGKSVFDKYTDKFFDELGKLDEAENKREKEALIPGINEALFAKVGISHLQERAYAGACLCYERNTPDCIKAVKEGKEFIEGIIYDYDYLPGDKQVYWHWIRILSCEDDDPDKLGSDEKPMPRYNEDVIMEKGQPKPNDYYNWNSDKARHLFQSQFVAAQEKGAGATKAHKIRGLFYTAESWVRFARGAHQRIKRITDPAKKKAQQEHAQKLEEQCAKYVNDIVRKRSTITGVDIDPVYRLSARLNIKSEFHIFLAEKAKDAEDLEGAKKEMEKALAECGKTSAEGGAQWTTTVQSRIVMIQKHAVRILSEELINVGSVIAKADKLYREAFGERKDEKKQLELFRQTMDTYREAYSMIKGSTSVETRQAYEPKLWDRIATCAVKLKDFDIAYIFLFEMMQSYNYHHYDLSQDAEMSKKVSKAIGNIRYVANQMLQRRRNAMTEQLYVDAMMMVIYVDKNAPETLIIALIDQLKRSGRFDEAADLCNSIAPGHSFYTLVQLMAADIWGKKKKRMNKLIERLEKTLAKEKDEKVQAEIKKEIEEKQKTADESGRKMVASAELFLKLALEVKDTPRPKDKKGGAAWDEVVSQIPAAYIISINDAFSSKKYPEVITKVDDYMKKVIPIKEISDEVKNRYIADAQWMRFLSILQGTDVKTASYEEAEKAFNAATKAIDSLEKYPSEKGYASQAYISVGLTWIALGSRAKKEAKAMPEGDEQEALLKRSDAFSKLGADILGKAEGIAYKKLNIALNIGLIYSQQEMYEEAVKVYDRGIQFWSESLYTPDYLFLEGKTLADLKSAEIPGDIRGSLDGIIDISETKSAADNVAAVAVLNKAIRAFKPKASGEKAKAIFKAAAAENKDDKELLDNIKEAEALLKRSDIAISSMLRQKIARTAIECVFPKILTRGKPIPAIITREDFSNVIKGITQKYPPSRDGRTKGAVIKAMVDFSGLSGKDSDNLTERGRVAEFRAAMKKEAAKADTPAKRKNKLLSYDSLFDPSLVVYLYGVMDQGKLKKRSFPRARQHIMGILDLDKNMLPIPELKEMPIKDFLMGISEALKFNASIIQAKRNYAKGLAKIGKDKQALELLEKLIEYSPDDTNLLLARASIYTSIGARMGKDDYNSEIGGYFMKARMEIKYVKDRTRKGSDVSWEATILKTENEAEEVLARKKHNKNKVDIRTKVKVWYVPRGRTKGSLVEVAMQTPPDLEKQAKALLTDLMRMLDLQELPENIEVRINRILERLKEAGYTPPKAKAATYTPDALEDEEEKKEGDAGDDGKAKPDDADTKEEDAAAEKADKKKEDVAEKTDKTDKADKKDKDVTGKADKKKPADDKKKEAAKPAAK